MKIDKNEIVADTLKCFAKKAENQSIEYNNRSNNKDSINYAYAFGMFSANLQYALMDLNLTKKQLAQLQASLNV